MVQQHEFKPFVEQTVVVADGAIGSRSQVRSTISRMGFHRVIEVESGKRLLSLLNNQRLGAVVCDYELPDMSGFDVLRQMRDSERYLLTPFILTATELTKESILDLLQEGVSEMLLKPFTTLDLMEKLLAALRLEQQELKRLR